MKKVCAQFFTLFLTLSAFSIFPQASNAATIFLIESYHKEYDWDVSYKRAIEEQLSEHKIITFEMDTKRLPKDMHKQRADAAWAKYNEIKPDYVILGDDNALKYLGPKFAETNTPIIFLGINNNPRDYFENKMIPKNFTGILERPLLNRSIVQIKRLFPKAKKFLVLFDNGITSRNSITPEMANGKVGNVIVEYKLIDTQKEWKSAVQQAKSQNFDGIIIGLYHAIKDDNGEYVLADDILSWTNKNTEVPLFALWNFAVGEGKACGGTVLDGYKMGESAASITKEVISGKNPRVRINKDGTPLFSKSELKRWNIIVPKSLEKDSILIE